MSEFTGFTQTGLDFLQNVKIHNSRQWFAENRTIYDNQLVKPFRALVEELTPTMLQIDQWFETKPAIGKTLSRINRDTRFSKDKSLYRDRLWLTFKRPSKDWKESPCYFFEIDPEGYRYGLGYYRVPKQTMDIFRDEINQDHNKFLQVINCVKKPFELYGECYKRPLVKDLPPKIANWYNRKDIGVLASSNQIEDLFSKNLIQKLSKSFKQLIPLYDYLLKVEIIKNIPTL
jgi:TIGR02453 family protein